MAGGSGGWMPRDRWDALVRGQDCPVCAEIASSESSSEEGLFVADLSLSRLRLQKNQFVPGYSVLLCRRHVREPYDLGDSDRSLFFDDMMRVGRALDEVFSPLKMNFTMLGNAVPHLHAHVLPRYYGDPAPHHPIDPNAGRAILGPDEYEQRVNLIRRALGVVDLPA
ncbi:MAG TPA: HIT family protein [Chloroflexota bacterium]|nr:HIT family protein [Chloroflexota bacterium]